MKLLSAGLLKIHSYLEFTCVKCIISKTILPQIIDLLYIWLILHRKGFDIWYFIFIFLFDWFCFLIKMKLISQWFSFCLRLCFFFDFRRRCLFCLNKCFFSIFYCLRTFVFPQIKTSLGCNFFRAKVCLTFEAIN